MTDLTPAEHRQVRANAYLMWRRWLAEDDWCTPQPTARLEPEPQEPPQKSATHPHMRSWHYDPRTRKARGRRPVVR